MSVSNQPVENAKELNASFNSNVSNNSDPTLVLIDEDNTFQEPDDVEVNLF